MTQNVMFSERFCDKRSQGFPLNIINRLFVVTFPLNIWRIGSSSTSHFLLSIKSH